MGEHFPTGLTPARLRWHLAASLSRGLMTGLLVIYTSSAFVTVIGATHYAGLIFLSFLASLIVYALSLFVAPLAVHRLYGALVAAAAVLSAASFKDPSHAGTLYLLALGSWVLDTVGIHVALLAIQSSSDPVHFRPLYQKVNHFELIGRAAAALWMLCESRGATLHLFYYVLWASAAAHLGCVLATEEDAAQPSGQAPKTAAAAWGDIQASLDFIVTNPLIRIALLVLVWARLAKFSVEAVFYQAIQGALRSVSQASLLIAASTAAILVFTVLFQRLAGDAVSRRASLSSVLSVLPIGILLFGSAALLASPLWPAIGLMVFYQCIFKVLFFPSIRQCLVPVPPKLSQTILSIVMLFSLIANIAIGGVMTGLREHLLIPQFLGLLLLISALLLYVTTRLDSFYIRNLWSHYVSGRWTEAPLAAWGEELAAVALQEGGAPRTTPAAAPREDPELSALLEIYTRSFDPSRLREAVRAHKELLRSPDRSRIDAGLRLMGLLALPEYRGTYRRLGLHPDPAIRARAKSLLAVEEALEGLPLSCFPVPARRELHGLLEEAAAQGRLAWVLAKIQVLAGARDAALIGDWVLALHRAAPEERELIFQALRSGPESFEPDFGPLLTRLLGARYQETASLRETIVLLSRDGGRDAAAGFARRRLRRLVAAGFNLWKPDSPAEGRVAPAPGRVAPAGRAAALQEFLHVLFLSEWLLGAGSPSSYLLNTIPDFDRASDRELAYLVELHLEYLKPSPFYHSWERLMGRVFGLTQEEPGEPPLDGVGRSAKLG